MKKNTIPKKECKFYLDEDTKKKLVGLAINSKTNQSDFLANLINNFDFSNRLIENVNYVNSREKIFEEMAKFAFSLKEDQKELRESQISLKEEQAELVSMIAELNNHLLDYKNSIVNHSNKVEKELINQKNKSFVDNIKEKLVG